MKIDEFKHIIAFCILMQNGRGILDKAPLYLLEKYETAKDYMLDSNNILTYKEYFEKWGRIYDFDKEEV